MAGRDVLDPYRRAQDSFDAVLSRVPAGRWDEPSSCELWTVRDVAGHVIWGQNQLAHWATGQDYGCADGAPGAPHPHPAGMAGSDPLATWRSARAAADETLTGDALDATVTLPGLGATPLSGIVILLVTDLLAHGWDIGHPLGLDVRHDPDLVSGSLAWARDNVIRAPGFFGPELTPPADAGSGADAGGDEQTRWLAYLGRQAWTPALTHRSPT